MGRVTGVLHAAAAPGEAVVEDELVRLELIAERSGSRLGAMHALDQVQRQAALDGLTGLPNRRSFENTVRGLRPTRYGLLLADLDRFKAINDTFGHAAGDQALRRFADVLRGCLRDADLPCRLGGEEFVVAVPDADATEAAVVAERLRAALAESARGAAGPSFTVSIGVADSTMAATLPEQLALADGALLAAKRAGRDRTLVAQVGDDPVGVDPVDVDPVDVDPVDVDPVDVDPVDVDPVGEGIVGEGRVDRGRVSEVPGGAAR
jgi:diguanylate cyclase (GGDEF)-like protein